jgi:hypothetical protein
MMAKQHRIGTGFGAHSPADDVPAQTLPRSEIRF